MQDGLNTNENIPANPAHPISFTQEFTIFDRTFELYPSMNRTARHIVISVILFVLIPTLVCSQNQDETKYGALAIDRGNGFYYGWAIDRPTLAEAEKEAIEECNSKGGKCTVVLSFSGAGCAAYRFITGNVGMGYGWGLAPTREEIGDETLATKDI